MLSNATSKPMERVKYSAGKGAWRKEPPRYTKAGSFNVLEPLMRTQKLSLEQVV